MTNNSKGNYYRPVPLDFAILEALPDKGMIGGIHWKGLMAKHVRQAILDAIPELDGTDLKPTTVASRLRSMNVEGLVEPFAAIGSSGTQIWARTPEGVEYLARKEEVLGA
jgi:hypothetical protein